jgi:hypothetical protein
MNRWAWWIGGSALAVGLIACPDFPPGDVCGYPGFCDGSTDGGGGDSATDAPPGCDATADPKDAGACVVDGFGIFVDATNGNDMNLGTKESPVKTIAAALALAMNNKIGRLYVCGGTYAEDVTLDAAHDGISIYGGWQCGAWTYDANQQPLIGKSNLAMTLNGLMQPILIEDVHVKAADGTMPGGSSLAVLVANCVNVTFNRVKLEAGVGQNGAFGALTNYTYPTQSQLNGNDSTGADGGAAQVITCPAGDSTTGAKGGDNGFPGDNGKPMLDGGLGGTGTNCGSGGSGGTGANGLPGTDGLQIASIGALGSAGWTPTSGPSGQPGGAGQGGGGGAGAFGSGGGGGGCGGCGGTAGGGGGGGGGSVAIAVLSSTVAMNASSLAAGTCGNGGNGVLGQIGETTFGDHGNGAGAACQGGNGGLGGNGGAGAGGAGGISVGVLWKGSPMPALDGTTTSQIMFGSKGTKGSGGNGNDGIDGVAQAVFQSP